MVQTFGLHFYMASDFRVWQLFTYMFLHGSWSHVLLNMFSLWMFGRIIEQTMSQKRYLIYYIVCGVGAVVYGVSLLALRATSLSELKGVLRREPGAAAPSGGLD